MQGNDDWSLPCMFSIKIAEIRMKNAVLMLLCLGSLVGCRPESELHGDVATGSSDSVIDGLRDGEVILRVNGEEITKRDFLVASSLSDKLRRMCAGDALTGSNKPAEEHAIWNRPRVMSDVLRRKLLRQHAKRRKIEPSPEDVEGYSKRLLRSLKRSSSTVRDVAKEIGGREADLFLQYVIDDAVEPLLRADFDKEGVLNVTDADVMGVSNRIERMRAVASVSNDFQRAVLETVRKELLSGANISDVARKYSRDPEQADVWETDYFDEMESSPQLQRWAMKAQTGDVSEILELDDGWAVVKVVSRRLEDLAPGEFKVRSEVWELVRITRDYYEMPPCMEREEIVERLFEMRSRQVQKRLAASIMADAVVEWPQGTNLFSSVSSAGGSRSAKNSESNKECE